MATWRLRWLARAPSRLWLQPRSHLSIALQYPSPASLEVQTVPYPDTAVFEPMSDEYASVAASGARPFTPLSSSETLASLVLKGNFQTAESLRKEMTYHHIPIPHDVLYLRAALHAITERRPKGSARGRLDAFEAWLSLAPDRHEQWQSFNDIRLRLFRSMDHLNLMFAYRFGVVLASKGYYHGNAAMQVVSILARYARLSVVERYLREIEDASRDYHMKRGMDPPSDLLAGAYNLAVRTAALGGKDEAALGLISMAQSRGINIPDFTLNIVAKHALDRQMAIDQIQAAHPSWVMEDTDTYSTGAESETVFAEHTPDVATLAARLRSLRTALRSPSPPSPHALQSFIASYQALGRTRALKLLRSLAYRHSPKSMSAWAFTEMLHHRSRREHIHVLSAFSQHFHPVGVPRKTMLSLIRGTRGKQARKELVRRWVVAPCPMSAKLWPSAYHTAVVWEAIVALSPKAEKERLYALLCALVRQSQRRDRSDGSMPEPDADPPKVVLPPDAFDGAHFSPFVSAWARSNPVRAAGILRDMVHLGIEPSLIQWSILARGYAQHGDPDIALGILDRLTDLARGRMGVGSSAGGVTGNLSDKLLGAHTNVLRGFAIAGDVQRARKVEKRLVDGWGYRAGDRPATDASITLLRSLEERLALHHEP